MKFRTELNIEPSACKIACSDPVMMIGSCFASSMGMQFEAGNFPVMINPSGTVFNPVSVCNTLNTIAEKRKYGEVDLINYKGNWISLDHYTDFSSHNMGEILKKINNRAFEAGEFIAGARFLFITFGTARVYRWKESGKIVSNCHKIPGNNFIHELLTPGDIISLWQKQLDKLQLLYPSLKIVFTISPVRHWKDGAHGNQVSKSVLFLAVEELLKHPSRPSYFPAYELLMDDLRDYRFYDDDMIHPSKVAIEYIWNEFTKCWFDEATVSLWKEVVKIKKAVSHRIKSGSSVELKKFAENMISRIDTLKHKTPCANLESERNYFTGLTCF